MNKKKDIKIIEYIIEIILFQNNKKKNQADYKVKDVDPTNKMILTQRIHELDFSS